MIGQNLQNLARRGDTGGVQGEQHPVTRNGLSLVTRYGDLIGVRAHACQSREGNAPLVSVDGVGGARHADQTHACDGRIRVDGEHASDLDRGGGDGIDDRASR